MSQPPVLRTTLLDQVLQPATPVARVEVRRITLQPSVAGGAHRHNGAVFATIEQGSATFQVGEGPEVVLHAGDVFYEPADTVITKFDATEEGVTFVGHFLLAEGQTPELTPAQ
jgi:quercetin dioxygenase-like cupin family protein